MIVQTVSNYARDLLYGKKNSTDLKIKQFQGILNLQLIKNNDLIYFYDIEEFKDVLKCAIILPVQDYGYTLHIEKPTIIYHKKRQIYLKVYHVNTK